MDLTSFVFTTSFVVTEAVTAFCLAGFFKASLLTVIMLSPVIAIPAACALTLGVFFILSRFPKFKKKDRNQGDPV